MPSMVFLASAKVPPSAEREALRTLLTAGGTLPVANFSQRFGSIRSVGPARLEREQLWRNPISPAENLWYLGLLYRGFEQLPNGAINRLLWTPEGFTLVGWSDTQHLDHASFDENTSF